MKHEQLVNQLRHRGGASFNFEDVLEMALTIDPKLISYNDHEKRVLSSIKAAESDGALRLPSRDYKNNWFQRGGNSIPAWVRVVAPKKPKEEQINPFDVSWVPKMGWAVNLNQAQLRAAVKINEFFRLGGPKYEMSINERSLQIFGDEKVLKDMIKAKWFKESELTLKDLGCYVQYPPLVVKEYDVVPRCAIIIENMETFHSFCKWNETSQQYSLIIYGSGNQFTASFGSLLDLKEGCLNDEGVFEYFGDLDPAGLHIPAYAEKELRELGAAYNIVPATRFYTRVLQEGVFRPIKGESKKAKTLTGLGISWMPDEIKSDVLNLAEEELMVPQEVLNYEILMNEF